MLQDDFSCEKQSPLLKKFSLFDKAMQYLFLPYWIVIGMKKVFFTVPMGPENETSLRQRRPKGEKKAAVSKKWEIKELKEACKKHNCTINDLLCSALVTCGYKRID